MTKELINKYINNQCSVDELASVLKWFEDISRTTEGKKVLSAIWEGLPATDEGTGTDYAILLDKIHHKINISQSTKLLETSDIYIRKFKSRHYLTNLFKNAAAILLLPAIGFGLFMITKFHSIKQNQTFLNQVYTEIFSSVDAITVVTLPDGSKVWLNHSSSLRYPSTFQGKTRNVELYGEGYFEVAHNTKIPFIVKAGDIEVIARGTTFDISAYPDEDIIETLLIEGNVEFHTSESEGTNSRLLNMKPTDMVIFNKSTKEIRTQIVKDDRYFSWKAGKLVFNKEPLDEVIKHLSRWFNVEIQIKDPELHELTYTATFINESLPQVMELIAMVTPVKYSISTREEISPGVFSKRTVVLRKR